MQNEEKIKRNIHKTGNKDRKGYKMKRKREKTKSPKQPNVGKKKIIKGNLQRKQIKEVKHEARESNYCLLK